MPEPICPNEELERLRDIADQCARLDHRMSDLNMETIAEILGRVSAAQAEGRVASDPNDDQPWNHQILQRRLGTSKH